jgi:hypothetical protein
MFDLKVMLGRERLAAMHHVKTLSNFGDGAYAVVLKIETAAGAWEVTTWVSLEGKKTVLADHHYWEISPDSCDITGQQSIDRVVRDEIRVLNECYYVATRFMALFWEGQSALTPMLFNRDAAESDKFVLTGLIASSERRGAIFSRGHNIFGDKRWGEESIFVPLTSQQVADRPCLDIRLDAAQTVTLNTTHEITTATTRNSDVGLESSVRQYFNEEYFAPCMNCMVNIVGGC